MSSIYLVFHISILYIIFILYFPCCESRNCAYRKKIGNKKYANGKTSITTYHAHCLENIRRWPLAHTPCVYVKEKKIRKNKLACVPGWILPFKNKRHCRDGWTVVGKRRTMDKGNLGIEKTNLEETLRF